MIRLSVRDISIMGRSTVGVKLKNLTEDGDRIVSVTKYSALEEEEEDV